MIQQIFERISGFIEESKYSGLLIAFVCFLVIFFITLSNIYKTFELRFYDIRFSLKPSIEEWDRLTFIDIDENSLTTIGQFPWPRYIYGQGLRTMKRLGVAQAALDIMFPDESPQQVDPVLKERILAEAARGGRIRADDIEEMVINNDAFFAEGVREMGKTVLSYTFSEEPPTVDVLRKQGGKDFLIGQERFISKATVKIPDKEIHRYKSLEDQRFKFLSYPIPSLMKAAHSFGFVNRYTDIDGITRMVRLVQLYQNRLYFNLSFVMVMDLCGVSLDRVEVVPGKWILLKNAFNPMTHETGDMKIPIDSKGRVYVNWAGTGPREETFNIIPYYALIDYDLYAYGDGGVHDYFDVMGANGDNLRIAKIEMEINKLKKEYQMGKDPSLKKEKYLAIKGFRNEIRSIREGYNNTTKEEIKKIEKELRDNDNPQLREELELLRNQVKAVDLVIRLENLEDHIVITGLTATGTHDIGAIPIYHEYPNVGTYHNTINTILNGSYINKIPHLGNYILMVIVAFLMGFTIQRLNIRMSLITITASFIGLNLIIFGLFIFFNLWIEQVGLNLAMLFPSMVIASIKFLNEERQKRFIKNAFSHYIAPDVIEEIIENPETLELGGEERNISIFFSDVEGFSGISEKLSPRELVNLLNEYLSEMTDIILSRGGTIDKYEGDAIMAFYGAPQPYKDHPLKACLAAIEMKRRLKELQEKWRAIGQDELKARMGINTGMAVVGNMGSTTRMDYTAMGDSVNLASRLEGVNKVYRTYAMISESTYEQSKDYIEARELDKIRVVGKNETVNIYERLGEKGSLPDRMYEMLEKYYLGLESFRGREWKKAQSYFKQGLKIIDDDGPSQVYVERCSEFMKKPPSKKWDGVYSMKTK